MGTGVVGFNSGFQSALMGDINPHLVRFYNGMKSDEITPEIVDEYLAKEGVALANSADAGYEHYRMIRARFNSSGHPLDFLFLNRAGFNGMIRFSKKSGWNIPFCKKPQRFIGMLKTKIVNQVARVRNVVQPTWKFSTSSFQELIEQASANDIIYCDPPYLGRHSDYFSSWSENDESELARLLKASPARFILSTWHHNDFRSNTSLSKHWTDFHIVTREHFYHAGAKESNRRPVVEALVMNFTPVPKPVEDPEIDEGGERESSLQVCSTETQISLGI